MQIDGSHHRWLGKDGPMFTLLLAVDDATGTVPAAMFCREEDTPSYFLLMDRLIKTQGIPIAIYSDRHPAFKFTGDTGRYPAGPTQFARAMEELGIRMVFARSPQAKGRVERVFPEEVKDLRENLHPERHGVLVNCWCAGNHESAAMWERYGQHIAICTTSERLCRSFVCEQDIHVGKISYIDYENDRTGIRDFTLYLQKRHNFEDEHEVRAITRVEEGSTRDWSRQYYEVDIEVLIDTIVVATSTAIWFLELVQAMATKYGLRDYIARVSQLGANPIF